MINLPTSHPDVHEYLTDGNFSTQIRNDCTPMVVLQWIRKLKKPLTKILRLLVALKDSVQKKGAVSKYYITADYRASCITQRRYKVDSNRNGL